MIERYKHNQMNTSISSSACFRSFHLIPTCEILVISPGALRGKKKQKRKIKFGIERERGRLFGAQSDLKNTSGLCVRTSQRVFRCRWFFISNEWVWHSFVLTVGVKCGDLLPIPFEARNGTQVPEMDTSCEPEMVNITNQKWTHRVYSEGERKCDSENTRLNANIFFSRAWFAIRSS